MSSVLQHPTMPENHSGRTVTRRYLVEVTAEVAAGQEPTTEQIRDFFNAFFSEGFKDVWQAANCDRVKNKP